MSNEAQVSATLNLRRGQLQYRSSPSSFRADVNNPGASSPGYLVAVPAGTVVDLSRVPVKGGFAWIQNLDSALFAEVGLWDGAKFRPFAEVLPGEFYILRLSRYLGSDLGATGTGTAGGGEQLMVRGVGGNVDFQVDAFGA